MSKIIQAMNAMIANQKKIKSVRRAANGEIFFIYNNKHSWGLNSIQGEHFLYFYPDNPSVETLLSVDDWENIPMVVYKESDMRTREATSTFAELYSLLNEKVYGIDDVLDDILADDDL